MNGWLYETNGSEGGVMLVICEWLDEYECYEGVLLLRGCPSAFFISEVPSTGNREDQAQPPPPTPTPDTPKLECQPKISDQCRTKECHYLPPGVKGLGWRETQGVWEEPWRREIASCVRFRLPSSMYRH